MSFQRGQVHERESIGGGSRSNKPNMTASGNIDSSHRAIQRWNDMPSEACLNQSKNQPPMSFQRGQVRERESNSQPPMSFQRGQVRERDSIGGGSSSYNPKN